MENFSKNIEFTSIYITKAEIKLQSVIWDINPLHHAPIVLWYADQLAKKDGKVCFFESLAEGEEDPAEVANEQRDFCYSVAERFTKPLLKPVE